MNKTKKMRPRPQLAWFAERMESKLRANDHKGGWLGDDMESLLRRLDEELRELWHEYHSINRWEKFIDEAADVANFAMMVADKARRNASGKIRKPGARK